MGEVVGKAASVCKKRDCSPREVYEKYWFEMEELLKLPGKAFRATVNDEFTIPKDALPLASSEGPATGIDPASLEGVVIDNRQAVREGNWTAGTGLKGFVATTTSTPGAIRERRRPLNGGPARRSTSRSASPTSRTRTAARRSP